MTGEDGTPDVDMVLTVRELVRMIRSGHFSGQSLPEQELDEPLGGRK